MSKATRSIRLDIPYPLRVLKQNGVEGREGQPETISLQLMIAAVNLKYRDGRPMTIPHLRIWNRIQDVMMDDDGKARTGPLTLSVEQFEWLYETMSTNQYPPNFAGGVVAYLDYLEGLRKLADGKPKPHQEEEQEAEEPS